MTKNVEALTTLLVKELNLTPSQATYLAYIYATDAKSKEKIICS